MRPVCMDVCKGASRLVKVRTHTCKGASRLIPFSMFVIFTKLLIHPISIRLHIYLVRFYEVQDDRNDCCNWWYASSDRS